MGWGCGPENGKFSLLYVTKISLHSGWVVLKSLKIPLRNIKMALTVLLDNLHWNSTQQYCHIEFPCKLSGKSVNKRDFLKTINIKLRKLLQKGHQHIMALFCRVNCSHDPDERPVCLRCFRKKTQNAIQSTLYAEKMEQSMNILSSGLVLWLFH